MLGGRKEIQPKNMDPILLIPRTSLLEQVDEDPRGNLMTKIHPENGCETEVVEVLEYTQVEVENNEKAPMTMSCCC